MTSSDEPTSGLPVGPGTDISIDPADLAEAGEQTPATSDPAEFDGDGEALGGTGGENAGGAG